MYRIEEVANGQYIVQRIDDPMRTYIVDSINQTCNCPDFTIRKHLCKHLLMFVKEEEEQTKINFQCYIPGSDGRDPFDD